MWIKTAYDIIFRNRLNFLPMLNYTNNAIRFLHYKLLQSSTAKKLKTRIKQQRNLKVFGYKNNRTRVCI